MRTDCPRLVLCTLGAPERGAPDGIPNDLRSDHEANSRSTCVSGTCRPAWLRGWTSYCCWTRVAATGGLRTTPWACLNHLTLEAPFQSGRHCQPGHGAPRPAVHQTHSGAPCARSGADPASAARWLPALVLTQNGGGDEGQPEHHLPPDRGNRCHLTRLLATPGCPGRPSVGGSLAAGSSLLARGQSGYGTSRPPGTHEPQSPASHDRETRVTTRLRSAPAACSCFERGESRPFVHLRSGNRRGQSRLCSCRTQNHGSHR